MTKSTIPLDKSDLESAETWDLPYVEDPNNPIEERPTNALNLRSGWKYEPPEQEEEILPPTAEEIEAIRAAAYEEGFAEGKAEGHQQGREAGLESGKQEGLESGFAEGKAQALEEGQQQAAEILATFESVINQLHTPLEQINEEVKKQVTLLATTLARSVIQTELTTNEQVILTALENGLNALPINETQLHILLNPEDIPLINQYYTAEKIAEKGWTITEKPSLERGGCEVVSKNNAVDVSVERRTRDVIDGFLVSHGITDE